MIDGFSVGLLRGHVVQRPEDDPGLGQRDRRSLDRRRVSAHQFRQAEIEDAQPPAGRDDDVARFQVAVNDAGVVRGPDGVRDLEREFDGVPDRQPAARNQVAERQPVHELHDDEVRAFVRRDVIHRDDVRVVERRGGTGLAEEPFPAVRVRRVPRGQELDRDEPLQAGVARLVDDAHAPFAQLFEDLVVEKLLSDQRIRWPG